MTPNRTNRGVKAVAGGGLVALAVLLAAGCGSSSTSGTPSSSTSSSGGALEKTNLTNTFEVMTLPGSGITAPGQLAGKTVAVNLTNNVQTLTLDTVLKADKVNPSSVHYVVVPFPDMLAALKAHRVDAVSVIEPYITAGKDTLSAVPVVSQCTGPTAGFPLSGYFATLAWTQKYPNTARAFQRAMEKAQALADSDPAVVRDILPTYTKITPKAAAALSLNSYPSTLAAAQIQPVETLMLSAGMLKSPLPVSSLIMP